MNIVGACAAALLLGACGTVTRGTTADVTFNSAPAGAHVQTSIGLSCPATPCTFPISRKQAFVATFSLPGHEEQQIAVKTDISSGGAAGFAGNIIVGGLVGMAVDASTSAALDHQPNPVFATMVPTVKPKAAPTQRARRGKRPAV
ncbi:translation initiation factor 2 [Bosea rubneri]|uniref:Translation initiation factor 2 n=1 Tax=Bosea rubneri TaxID=3075434 RepID=A0ABU3SGQ6_9HYPH|nr:translation initiation factor 2 [Bosea sp. ZW T0_25]MDU0343989.1 translation initiation factor 2 [Bosea sp. ZW T0_25]